MELTAVQARSLLAYDRQTGLFSWRITRGGKKAGSRAGYLRKDGYVEIVINRRHHFAHRLAWLIAFGTWPHGDIDHKNCIRNDNRLENLRDATRADNSQNRRLPSRNNTTGLLGVTKVNGKFQASIWVNCQGSYLGLFETAEQAHAAYVEAKRRLHPACTI